VGTILAFGLAAAAYPQLLAVVVVILTRPTPKPLLWACYLGGIGVNMGCGAALLVAFRNRDRVLGTTSHSLGAAAYLTVGMIALLFAVLAATSRGRALLAGDLPLASVRRRARRDEPGRLARVKDRANQSLRRGSLPVAAVFGGILGLPGPFDLLAFGYLARHDYSTVALAILLIAFCALKFLLIEAPIASYAIDPEATAARVERFSAWMKANKITILAGVIGAISLLLIWRGISKLG
jgi:hypothetical protein